MHVVEATLYYSAGMVPVLVAGLHPVVPLAWIIDCAVGAWLGHDGFQVLTGGLRLYFVDFDFFYSIMLPRCYATMVPTQVLNHGRSTASQEQGED